MRQEGAGVKTPVWLNSGFASGQLCCILQASPHIHAAEDDLDARVSSLPLTTRMLGF